jgi:hypothetical protein
VGARSIRASVSQRSHGLTSFPTYGQVYRWCTTIRVRLSTTYPGTGQIPLSAGRHGETIGEKFA